jgi:hypothetical protein
MVCKLGVFLTHSLPLFERNPIYSYFDELLEANTSYIPLLQVLLGIFVSEALTDISERCVANVFISMYIVMCKYFFSLVTHIMYNDQWIQNK